jgi:hypothetical protein
MYDETDLSGAAPQSGEDVAAVVRDLRLVDPRFGVRWEPKAVMTKRGGYNAVGGIIDPEYRGLWEVVLDDKTVGTADWRPWTRVCFVTQPTRIGSGLMAMADDGPYAPLGAWLVEFLREADKHNNAEAQRLAERLERINARYDQAVIDAGDDATEEAASRQYHAGTAAGGGVSEFHPVGIDLKKP